MLIDKNRMQIRPESIHPCFGEIIRHGAKEGVFVGLRNNHQYVVHYYGDRMSSVVPASLIRATGDLDQDFLDSISKNKFDVKRKGGMRTGPRKTVRSRVDLLLKKKSRRMAGLKEGAESKEQEEVSKNTKVDDKWDVEEKVSCLSCGKMITPDDTRAEPFRCPGKCQRQDRIGNPIYHSPAIKE